MTGIIIILGIYIAAILAINRRYRSKSLSPLFRTRFSVRFWSGATCSISHSSAVTTGKPAITSVELLRICTTLSAKFTACTAWLC